MEEIWKDIDGYDGLYKVSNLGRIISCHRAKTKLLSLTNKNEKGYLKLTLCKNGKQKTYKVHRLVANAFLQNKNGCNELNHKDGNKLNNCVDNLEWITHKENIRHSYRTGLHNIEKMRLVAENMRKHKH